MTAVRCGRRMIVAAVLAWCAGGTAYGQCLLSGLFNRPSTYAAQYGTYATGYTAYMPISVVPTTTYMPVTYAAPTVTYRAAYRPLAPSLGTTVLRPSPVLRAASPPVVMPYAVAMPTAAPTAAPTVVYRPVEIVVERRRLFSWRPFERWRARRTAYSLSYAAPTWTTTAFAGYALPLTVGNSDPSAVVTASYAPGSVMSGAAAGCSACGSSSLGLPLSAADAMPTLPSPGGSAGSSQPPSTYAPAPGGDAGESWKPATPPGVQGTGLPRTQTEEERPLVRQAVFVRPIPLVEESTDAPPLVEIQGWKRH